MSKPLNFHHAAWLSEHPHRTEAWLRDRLKDGFDVHHLDGDHENNDPKNLVLIDGADHMMLHNGKTRMSRLRVTRKKVDIEVIADGGCVERLSNGMLASVAKNARKRP